MSHLAFHVFERLNAAFDTTRLREEEERRISFAAQVVSFMETGEFVKRPKSPSPERAMIDSAIASGATHNHSVHAREPERRAVDWYRVPVAVGAPSLLRHYMRSFGHFDVPLSGTNEHLLHYAMNVGQHYAVTARHTQDSFQLGLAECTRIIAQNSERVLVPQRNGRTLATDAFNFVGLSEKDKHANAGARAEVVLATLYNQMLRGVRIGREYEAQACLPLFRPPETQPNEAAREAQYQVHNIVAIKLGYPDAYAAEIVRAGQRLDPEGLAVWLRTPPPPALRPVRP